MAVDKFKFISPGVFINEIDDSAIPELPERMGPVVVGRFRKGPSMRPVKVSSYSEFVSLFGSPADGNARGDIWRTGALTAPTYAAYAVQAWLRNNSPVTVFRLLGEQHDNADASVATAVAGWKTTNTLGTNLSASGGAYGLFIMPNSDDLAGGTAATASITFTGDPGLNSTITITSTDGTEKTYSGKTSANPAGNTFDHNNGPDTAASTLKDAIENAAGHGDKITVAIDGAALTLTQATAGVAGDKTIGTGGGLANTTIAGFGGGAPLAVTGTLAAIWYVNEGAVVLSGTARDGAQEQGAGVLIKSTNQKFLAKVVQDGGNVLKSATFNFDKNSDLFIRKVFNTDPTATNSDLVCTDCGGTQQHYWLGETFDSSAQNDLLITGSAVGSTTGDFYGVILGLKNEAGTIEWSDHTQVAQPAKTGWFISNDTRGTTAADFNPTRDTEKLFRLVALDNGEHINRDVKVSITDIKAPTDKFNKFGTFSVLVRAASDTDNNPVVLERFSSCNLDPASTNFIGRKIGDREYSYDSVNKVIRQHGDYPNRSKYFRVDTSPLVDNAEAAGLLPYGVYGPSVPKTVKANNGSTLATLTDVYGNAAVDSILVGSSSLPSASLIVGHTEDLVFEASTSSFNVELAWPTTRLRASSSEGDMKLDTQAYFGYQSVLKNTRVYDEQNLDLLRGSPDGFDPSGSPSNGQQYSWVFTLDDIRLLQDNTKIALYTSGSRATQESYTARSGSTAILDAGFNKFTSPVFGGFDGMDIKEKDPFRNNFLAKNPGETTNYAFYSIKKAIDVLTDKEYIEYDVATVPGLTNKSLNTQLVNMCEDRGDALAIIDVAEGYQPAHETNTPETSRVGSVDLTVSELKDYGLNSSYGCAFYPWVQVRDTSNDSVLYVPPSVVALGTFSSSQRKSEVWFAPAGFTRGGLTEGSSGLPVVGVRQRVTSAERDKLYDANINPIASFPAEGIVIFGQKTLQVTPSALDRINVRRLLIFLKKEISRISSRLLFEQNVNSTWARFKSEVVPFLDGVKSGLGLTDFKVVLDNTTTTDDLIDRNILYAKIFLKPARAIEFIALDFIISRTGASFED